MFQYLHVTPPLHIRMSREENKVQKGNKCSLHVITLNSNRTGSEEACKNQMTA